MSTQIENIKNPLLREFAEKAQHMSKGDFGMTIYGGVDLEAYAELIIRECFQIVDDFAVEQASVPETYVAESLKISMKITDAAWKITEHFDIEE